MNKKFLSAILFGALMVTSTGTFVSCKDYDDDIENLRGQISANASAIAELKTLIQSGDYVTNVAVSGQNLVVTFKNAGSQTIALPACEGEGGSLAEVKDNQLFINGEATGLYGESVKIVDGEWALLQDGDYVSTGIPVSGVTVAGNKTAGYVLTITDAEGTKTEIELPTAASKITNLSLGADPSVWPVQLSTYNDWKLSGVITDAANWKGTKTLPANGSKVYVNIEDAIDFRVDPVGIDATEFEYTLVNADNLTLPSFKMVASAQTDLSWSEGAINGRAAYGNGLYSLNVKKFVVAGGDFAVEDFEDAYNTYAYYFDAFAVTANGSYRSEYAVDVQEQNDNDADPALTKLAVKGAIDYKDASGDVRYARLSTTKGHWEVKVGSTNTIEFDHPVAAYDMFFTVEDKYIEPFGISWDNEKRTFKATKNPDSSSLKAGFPMTIYAVDNEGLTTATTIQIKLSTIISSDCVYEAQSHDVSSDYNYFTIDLAKMKESISSDFEAWKLNVDLSKTQITMYYGMNANGLYEKVYPGTDPSMSIYDDNSDLFEYAITSAVANDFSKATSDADDANYIQIAINNSKASLYKRSNNTPAFVLDHTYYAKVVFFSKEGQLNTIIVPVKFTAPALSDLFTVKTGFTDSEGVINAFFYNITATPNKTVDLYTYFSKYVKDAKVTLDGTTVIYDKKKSSELAESLSNVTEFAKVTMKLSGTADYKKDKNGVKQLEAGYGEALIYNVAKSNYAGWAYPVNRDGSCPNGSYTFKMRIMSPILEGEVKPVSSIEISGNDLVNGAKITGEMIMGYDYNSNTYNVVPDKYVDGTKLAWSNPEIVDVVLEQDTDKYINSTERVAATQDDKKNTVSGYFVIKGKSISQSVDVEVPVKVKDAWGYVLTSKLPVTIKKN